MFRLLFVHHLRLSDVAVSLKKTNPRCFVSLRNRGLQVRILPGVLTYVDVCPERCPGNGHILGHTRQYFTDPARFHGSCQISRILPASSGMVSQR